MHDISRYRVASPRARQRAARVRGLAVCLCVALAAPRLGAQQPDVPPGPLTLQQALDMAEARSEAIAISRAGVRRAEAEQLRARSGLFPQLSFTASYDRALASEFEGIFNRDFFGGGDDSGAGDGGDGGADGLEDLPFGRENTWRASLALSQNLYSGGRIAAQRDAALAGRETAGFGLATARAQLLFEVTQAYYDAVLSDRLVAIAEATVEQASATLRQAQAGYEAGTQPEFEVLRARVARDSQTPLLIRQRANRDIAMLRLKQLLELPADADLRLAEVLDDDRLPPPLPFAERVAVVEAGLTAAAARPVLVQPDAALPERTAVAEAEAGVRLREAALRLAQAQRMPSVTLNTTYTRVGYPSAAWPLFDRTNWSIGASVQLPILTGGRQRADEQAARAEFEQSQAQLQQTRELAALDTRSAWAELIAARAAWEATAGTVEQAQRAYEIANVRYQAGVSTQLELSDSRLQLQQAETSRAQAARDLQVARARVALLADLPLGSGGPARGPAQPVQPAPSAPSPPAVTQPQLRTVSAQGAPTQAGTR